MTGTCASNVYSSNEKSHFSEIFEGVDSDYFKAVSNLETSIVVIATRHPVKVRVTLMNLSAVLFRDCYVVLKLEVSESESSDSLYGTLHPAVQGWRIRSLWRWSVLFERVGLSRWPRRTLRTSVRRSENSWHTCDGFVSPLIQGWPMASAISSLSFGLWQSIMLIRLLNSLE